MLARQLETLLAEEFGKTDLSECMPGDVAQRFDSLRDYRLLPTGRTKNVTHLTVPHIVSAILSLVTVKPGFAGLAAKVLASRRRGSVVSWRR
jgi:hypothetical protein